MNKGKIVQVMGPVVDVVLKTVSFQVSKMRWSWRMAEKSA